MIIVILYRQEHDEFNDRGEMVSEAGTVWVSHGVDTTTGQHIILPGDKWQDFRHHCIDIGGEWYLK